MVEKPIVVTATPEPPTACHPDSLTTAQEIVIGALAPLSGRSATSGLSMQAGIAIAVDKINSDGGIQGKQIRLVTYDTASDPQTGVERTQQLITNDCAVGIVGIYDSDVGIAMKQILHQFTIPAIFVDTYKDEITADQLPEVFRISPTVTMFSEMASLWTQEVGDYNHDGQTFAAIVAEDSPYGQAQTSQTVYWFDQAKIGHSELFIGLPTTDFSSVIARIVDMPTTPDVIFVRIPGDNGLELEHQLLQNGIGPRNSTLLVMGQTALKSGKFWQALGEGGTSTVAMRMGPWPSTVTQEGKQFVEHYRQFSDQWPGSAAFSGYDAVRLLGNAISNADSLVGSDLISALEATSTTLASGTYSFPYTQHNPPNDTTPAYYWHQWLDAPILLLQYTEPNQSESDMAVIWPGTYRTTASAVVTPVP
ncbi:MAG: ABC transporter substrate-binding protein [Caldilineaceae bacterium]